MSATVLHMSMSLDGFIAGPNEGPGNGLGDGGDRLHEWSFGGETPVRRIVDDEFTASGATVAGRTTFELAGGWGAGCSTTSAPSTSSWSERGSSRPSRASPICIYRVRR